MRFLLISHIENARQSLRSNRLRSSLTMLGVGIGVASVTTILSLGGGASNVVGDQVDALGGNIAVIRPSSAKLDPLANLSQLQSPSNFTASTLTDADVAYIRQVPGVTAVAPLMILGGTVSGDMIAPPETTVVASTPDLQDISQLKIRSGQFLEPSLRENTAVIGVQTSVNIFGTEQSIGKTVAIRGKAFTVVGILDRINTPINYNNVDFDTAVIINESSARGLNQGNAQIQQINVQTKSIDQLQSAVVGINQSLLKTHLGETDFTILTGEQIAQPSSQLFYIIAGVTTAIAGISLLVGGIGIMNIMLVSVTERTREIGIRKAVGASNSDIIGQFLIESLILSLGGGIAGYIAGYAGAFIISTFLTFDPLLSWEIAAIAIGISVIIGTLFGLYPAIRAARKDPINALRQYD